MNEQKHIPHPHVQHPKDLIIEMENLEKNTLARFNRWLAVKITKAVGSMWCAYLFLILDLFMLKPVIQSHNVTLWVTYIAQTVLQLVLLPIIMVGQNVIQAQNDAKAETDHHTLTYLARLQDEQMTELKRQTEILDRLDKIK